MAKPTQITRNLMLKEMDIKFFQNGKRNIFSVKFVTKKGKLYFFPQAYVRGLPWNVADARQRGIQPCDCGGKPEGHVYPVSIDLFLQFNGMEVVL